MKQSVMISGSTGLLGQYLCNYFSKDYEVIALYRKNVPQNQNVSPIQLDLTSQESVEALFSKRQPDFLIHTAGLTSVDACEVNPQLAQKLNVDITANILKNLNPDKTRLIHISTDHLFSGHESFYNEQSPVTPVNSYAKSKHLAEKLVSEYRNSVTVRTNFYGGETIQKKSFSNWIYNELMYGNSVNLFDNVFFTPMSVHALAQNLELIMNSELTGIYNVIGSERISKYHFAMKLAQFFQLNTELIVRTKVEEAPLRAPRPHDMSLSIDKIKRDLPGFIQEDVLTGLQNIKSHHLV